MPGKFGEEKYHRIDQALVAIAQICGKPARGLVNGVIGPLPVLQL